MKSNKKIPISFSEKPVNYQKYEFQKVQALDSIQAVRYGFYRKSDFKKEKIKKIVINFNPYLKNIISSDPLIIAIKSLTKSFISELIEFSKQIMSEFEKDINWNQTSISKKIIKFAVKLYYIGNKDFRSKKN
jgi:hypothetical protein